MVFPIGARVGMPWLHRTCGTCTYCSRGAENLCDNAEFTGYTANGGYAEYLVAPEEFLYELPDKVADVQRWPFSLCRHHRFPIVTALGSAEQWTFGNLRFWCGRSRRHSDSKILGNVGLCLYARSSPSKACSRTGRDLGWFGNRRATRKIRRLHRLRSCRRIGSTCLACFGESIHSRTGWNTHE